MPGKANYALQIIVGAKDKTKAAFVRIANSVGRLNNLMQQAARRLALLGTAGAGALLYLTNSTTRAADSTAKFSRRIGLNAQALQAWRYAAELNGVETNVFDNALAKLGQRMAEARAGYGEGRVALHALGIQLTDAEGQARGLEEVFPELLTAIDKVADPTAKLAIAVKLFEQEGTSLIQMAGGGANALAQLGREARRTGSVLSDEQLQASEKYQDSLTKFKALVTGMKNRLVYALLPTIQRVATAINEWLLDNQEKFQAWSEWLATHLPTALTKLREIAVGVWDYVRDGVATAITKVQEFSQAAMQAFGLITRALVPLVEGIERVTGAVSTFRVLKQYVDIGRAGSDAAESSPVNAADDKKKPASTVKKWLNVLSSSITTGGALSVSFANAPAGTRVDRDAAAKRTTSLRVGYAMPEVPALG